jgi:hypothetical protein
MFLWFRKLFRIQIKVNQALCASPFTPLQKSPFIIPLQQSSRIAQKAYNIVSYFIFSYLGFTVWNQLNFTFISMEQFMLSLTFTAVILGFGMYKLMLFLRSNEILQLLNTFILFEIRSFGNNKQTNKHIYSLILYEL